LEWSERSFPVSMPHMIPDQLSEVELLKILAEAQWQYISTVLERPQQKIVNDQGERLYGSVINVDVCFRTKTPMDLGEGTHLHIYNAAQFYSRRFVEGFFCVNDAPLPPVTLQAIRSKEDLEKLTVPWAYITMAFVAREESNQRLKTFAPAGAEYGKEFTTDVVPSGIRDHEMVERTGAVTLPGLELALPVENPGRDEVTYDIVPESDLNGAGLLYFARYVAIANYGERLFLRQGSSVQITTRLIRLLTTIKRRVFYFANANESDSVKIRINAFVLRPQERAAVSATSVTPLTFYFVTELRRESDGTLMAKLVTQKDLTISKGIKSLILEAGRIAQQFRLPPEE